MITYSVCLEYLNNTKKLDNLTIFSSKTIEEIDNFTSAFTSFEEINRCYNNNFQNIFIITNIVGQSLDITFKTNDIVYASDKKNLEESHFLETWLIEYLTSNPNHIIYFKNINKIKKDNFSDYLIEKDTIANIVSLYLQESDYHELRDTYFILKKLDKNKKLNKSKVKKL